jgi:phosphatidylglycerol:prolipoprotein diacylglycerol transferase
MMKIDLDPILIDLGLIRLSWYGLMYVFGFLISYLLVRYQMKRKDFGISKSEVDDLYFYSVLGLIIGARLGYVLFYNLKMYLDNLLEIPAFWHGGMSFHGGLIGVLTMGILFCWKKKIVLENCRPHDCHRSYWVGFRKDREFHQW